MIDVNYKFGVGDFVTLRKLDELVKFSKRFEATNLNERMRLYAGKTYKVVEVHHRIEDNRFLYIIDCDGFGWVWNAGYFEAPNNVKRKAVKL